MTPTDWLISIIATPILLLLVFVVARKFRYREATSLAVIAFLVRVLAVLAVFLVLSSPSNPDGFAFQDDANIHKIAAERADALGEGKWVSISEVDYRYEKNPGYAHLLTFIYFFLGANTVLARLLNAAFASIIGVILYDVGTRVHSRQLGRTAALLFWFLPDLLFWSALAFKDYLLALLVMIALRGAVLERFGVGNVWTRFASVLAAGLALTIRLESGLALLAVLLVGIYLELRAAGRPMVGVVAAALGTAFVVTGYVIQRVQQGLVIGFTRFAGLLDAAYGLVFPGTRLAGGTPESQSVFLSWAAILGPQDLWRLPFAISLVLLLPFPPVAPGEELSASLLRAASFPWAILCWLIPIGLAILWRKSPGSRELIAYAVIQTITLSFLLVGFSPERHRLEVVPIYVMGIAMALISSKRLLFLGASVGTTALVAMAYMVVSA